MEKTTQNEITAMENLLENEPVPRRTNSSGSEALIVNKISDMYTVDGLEEPARVTAAFKEYVQMGKGRSLQKLAESLSKPENLDWTNNYDSVLRMLKDYSSRFEWQERLRQLITKASTEALAEAQREALRHTKERMRLAIVAQKAGLSIIESARLDKLSVDEARRLLKNGAELLKLGLSSERAEAGDNLAAIRPDKQPRDMTDEELEEYAEALYKNLN